MTPRPSTPAQEQDRRCLPACPAEDPPARPSSLKTVGARDVRDRTRAIKIQRKHSNDLSVLLFLLPIFLLSRPLPWAKRRQRTSYRRQCRSRHGRGQVLALFCLLSFRLSSFSIVSSKRYMNRSRLPCNASMAFTELLATSRILCNHLRTPSSTT